MLGHSIFPKALYLQSPLRSPIGKFGGSLKRFTAPQLAALTLRKAIEKAGPFFAAKDVDYVFMGHARQAGAGPNSARQATCFSGLSESIPALTINQACASGMIAVIQACEKIALGKARSAWAGGVESMSNTPYFLMGARWGYRMGSSEVIDGMRQDGFFCPMAQMLMGETVENVLVKEFQISRIEQDEFALRSQQKADRAWKEGFFKNEIFEIPAEGKLSGLKEDEHRRGETTLESLAKLQASFNPENGSITAGNSSGITDGAAFLHVSSEKSSASLVEVLDYEVVALDPRRMGLGPVEATGRLLARQGLKKEDIQVFELNEAFAAQVLACQRSLQISESQLNPWGGAIALGHPIGASGARILVTLAQQLKGNSGALGVASLCVSGGMGVATLLRAV